MIKNRKRSSDGWGRIKIDFSERGVEMRINRAEHGTSGTYLPSPHKSNAEKSRD